MSPDEIRTLIETTVRAVMTGMQGANGGGTQGQGATTSSHSRRTLDPKGVTRVDTFGGKENQWREWSFQFKVAIKAMEGKVAEILTKAEIEEERYKLEDLELEFTTLDVTKIAGELFDLLCLCLKGDPLILVQGVSSMNGLKHGAGFIGDIIQSLQRGHSRP